MSSEWTLGRLKAEYKAVHDVWVNSSQCASIKAILREGGGKFDINTVLSLDLGSFVTSNDEMRTRGLAQLDGILTIFNHFGLLILKIFCGFC
jgi:hypothetical protein